MNDLFVPHTPRPYSDYFHISYKISETFSATMFSAVIADSSKPTTLWVSKFPVDLSSPEGQSALDQMHNIDLIEPPVGPFDTYGIDCNGIAFMSFTEKISNNFAQPRGTAEEMERRLFKAVRLIHKVHQSGNFIGDLNSNSFWLNNAGAIDLTAILKISMSFTAEDLQAYDQKLLPFLAPEVFTRQISARSDVYALGVIAYELIINKLPIEVQFNENGEPQFNHTLENSFKNQIPPFLLEVLEKAISFDPNDRYASAGEFLEALVAVNERSKQGDRREAPVVESNVNILPAIRSKEKLEIEKYKEKLTDRLLRNAYKIIFSFIIFVILASLLGALLFYRHYRETLAREINEATAPFSGGNPELTKSIAQIANVSGELKDKIAEIQSLAESPDYLSYGLLVASAHNSKEDIIVKNSQSAIIFKLKKASLPLTATQLEQWFRYGNKDTKSPLYLKVLQLLDPTMPHSKRVTGLRELSREDLNIATRLTAALYFDLKQPDDFKDLLEEQIGKNIGIVAPEKLSGLALIMHHEALMQIFSEQITTSYSKLTNYDIVTLLEFFAKRDPQVLVSLIKITINKSLYPKFKLNLLEVILNNKNLNLELNEALIMLVLDKIDTTYLNRIIAWQGTKAEEVLFSIIYSLPKETDQLLVLENLATRNLQSHPGQGLIAWLKQNKWDQRQKYIQSLAILSTSLDFSDAQILTAIRTFQKDLSNSMIQNALLASGDERLALLLINNFSESIGLAQKLNLLRHPSVDIRKMIIMKLETNDVGAMKLIVDAYTQEQNLEVKELYKERYWFVKNR